MNAKKNENYRIFKRCFNKYQSLSALKKLYLTILTVIVIGDTTTVATSYRRRISACLSNQVLHVTYLRMKTVSIPLNNYHLTGNISLLNWQTLLKCVHSQSVSIKMRINVIMTDDYMLFLYYYFMNVTWINT